MLGCLAGGFFCMSSVDAQFFISYSRTDVQFVDSVARSVATLGYRPWVDRQQLAGSQQWSQELQRAIATSRALLVILTSHSLASAVVAQEYRYALACGIPVIVLRGSPKLSLPPELANCPIIEHHYISRLYVICRDLGLPTPPPIAGFDSPVPGAIYLAFQRRLESGWRSFRTPNSALIPRMLLGYCLTLAIWGFGVALSIPVPGVTTFSAAPLIFMGFIGLLPLLYALTVHLHVLHIVPGETLVLAPNGFSGAFLRQRGVFWSIRTQTFAYGEIEQMTPQRTWWGTRRLVMVGQGHRTHFDIPQRLRGRAAIVRQILTDWQAVLRQNTPPSTAPLPVASPALQVVSVATPASPPVPLIANPRYTIIAGKDDSPLLAELQAWLARRSIQPLAHCELVAAEGLLLPPYASIAASTFVFIVGSPAVLQSPTVQALVAEMENRRQPIIPLRVLPHSQLSGSLGQYQWIDFSAASARANSFLDLCDALDRLGCIAPPTPIQFDVEWIMARTKHQRPLPTWRVYWPAPASGQDRPALMRRSSVPGFLVICGVVLLGLVVYDLSKSDGFVSAIYTTIVFGLAVAFVAITNGRRQQRSLRFNARMAQRYYIPDMIVLTPQGLVIHAFESGTRFIDQFLPLTTIVNARVHTNQAGLTYFLVKTSKDTIKLSLDNFDEQLPDLAERINELVAARIS
jgi:TIR domain